MKTKICSRCKTEKALSDFYKCSRHTDGLASCCKKCQAEHAKKWYLKNKDHCKKVHAKYYKDNKENITISHKKYQKLHPWQSTEHERALARTRYAKRTEEQKERKRNYKREYQRAHKDKVAIAHKKYRDAHKKELKEYNRKYRKTHKDIIYGYVKNRRANDPEFKLKLQVRGMVNCAFRTKKHRKTSKTKDIVGCDLDFLYEYLRKTWKDRYGEDWNGQPCHIDHIVPLAIAKTKEDITRLCHYTNLQLLTPEDNMHKSDRLPTETPPHLLTLF